MKKVSMIKRLSSFCFVMCACAYGALSSANPITIDTSEWSYQNAPSSNSISKKDVFTKLLDNTPTKSANSSGSLISNFSFVGDFLFTGEMTATFADNQACGTSNDNSCDDNDLMGIVFGWQNDANHYRLGWGQGGINDITGKNGLFFIEEKNGKSNTIEHWENLFWQEDETYVFEINRKGNALNISLNGTGRSTAGSQGSDPTLASNNASPSQVAINYIVDNDTWLSGNVGVYTESQTAFFANLTAEGLIEVSEPFLFGLVSCGIVFLLARRKRAFATTTTN